MRSLSRARLTFILSLLAALGAVVVLQLIRLQLVEHATWAGSARAQQMTVRDIVPERGRIWDRNGELLAGNEPMYQVWVDTQVISDSRQPDVILGQLESEVAPLVGLTPDQLRALLRSGNRRVKLRADLSEAIGQQLAEREVPAVEVIPDWKRIYPQGTLAASVLGFYNEQDVGYYGLEGYYDAVLAGEPQSIPFLQDAGLAPLPLDVPPDMNVPPGADLVVTIDARIQMIVEEELARAMEATGAQSGIIIVLDPHSGEILALANAPTFDPNQYFQVANVDTALFVNPAVSEVYEPGSVFKIFTLAAALDAGVVTPETTYYDTACLEVGGQPLCNWDREAHGTVDMVGLMAKSLNVGAATLSLRMGAPVFYSYIHAFGFGRLTNVDLQTEAEGVVRTPSDIETWYESDLGTNAYGQGLSATPLQVIAAVAAVANDGQLVRPHVVKAIIQGERVREAQVVHVGQPIRPETARTVTQVLVDAVAREVPLAQVPGYRIAGKTGTAQIPIPGGYDPYGTIASFVGYGPASDPQLVVLVRLDRPTSSQWGSYTAAPVFQRVASRLFAALGIAPEEVVVSRQ